MSRILTAALLCIACSTAPTKVFAQAKCTIAVSSVTASGAAKTISIDGTISGVAAGWTPSSPTGTAIHQGTKVVTGSTVHTISEPTNGIYNWSCGFEEMPNGDYKIMLAARVSDGTNFQYVCPDQQSATMTGSAATAFTARGTVTIDAARVANPNTTIRCSGTASANAGWSIDGNVSAWSFPVGGGEMVSGNSAVTDGIWGNVDLTGLPAPPTNCYVWATMSLTEDGAGTPQVVASSVVTK